MVVITAFLNKSQLRWSHPACQSSLGSWKCRSCFVDSAGELKCTAHSSALVAGDIICMCQGCAHTQNHNQVWCQLLKNSMVVSTWQHWGLVENLFPQLSLGWVRSLPGTSYSWDWSPVVNLPVLWEKSESPSATWIGWVSRSWRQSAVNCVSVAGQRDIYLEHICKISFTADIFLAPFLKWTSGLV